MAAAVLVQVARLAADFPDKEPNWLFRNGGLFELRAPSAQKGVAQHVLVYRTAGPPTAAALARIKSFGRSRLLIGLTQRDVDGRTTGAAAIEVRIK